jgi:hypothetical protein
MQNQVQRTVGALQRCLTHALRMADSAIAAPDSATAEFAQNWAHFIWCGLELLVGDARIPESSRSHAERWKQFAEQWTQPNYDDLLKALTAFNMEKTSLQAALDEILKS